MSNFEVRKGQHKNALPIHIALVWVITVNVIDGKNLYHKLVPIGSTDAAERSILMIFLLLFILAIYFKSKTPNDPVDIFLYKNLPAILFGFSISFFVFMVFPIYIGLLIGMSGFLLYKERNET